MAIATYLSSCTNSSSQPLARGAAVQLDEGSSPYLTKDADGRTVLSWVRTKKDSSHVFCYAVANGPVFSNTVEIRGSENIQPHGENLPKIIFKPSGETIALWGVAHPNPKNKYSGLVYYAQSMDKGATWSAPRPLVSDTAGYDQRYYDVALLPDGEVAIIWLDNRKTRQGEGSALYFARTEGTKGFGAGTMVSQPSCPCCRTDLYVDSKGGIHALFRGIIQDSIRDMVHVMSADGGKTFSAPQRIHEDNWVIDGCPHTGPSVAENSRGLHFAWFTGAGPKGCFYKRSSDRGRSFEGLDSVSSRGAHPQIAALGNDKLLITWDESKVKEGKVFKSIGLEQRSAEGRSEWKAVIDGEGSDLTFPVLSTQGNGALLAYSVKRAGRSYVEVREVGNTK